MNEIEFGERRDRLDERCAWRASTTTSGVVDGSRRRGSTCSTDAKAVRSRYMSRPNSRKSR